jgi:hypothetical protein
MVSGHVYGYERFEETGKTFLVSGGGGGPRVRLLAERRRRHCDLYASRTRHRVHYLSLELAARSLSVEVFGLERGCDSFVPMETFDLELS